MVKGNRRPSHWDHLLDDPRVHPTARVLFRAVLNELREAGYPVAVVEVYRSPARQRQLYAQGRSDETLREAGYTAREIAAARLAGFTAEKSVVTKKMTPGKHAQGRAMDVAFVLNGVRTYQVPASYWKAYGRIVKKHGLIWGGDWKTFPDRPHCEYRGE